MRPLYHIAMCFAALLVIVGCEEKTQSEAKKPEVILTVDTNPKGATVLIDGKALGATTPFQHDFQDNLEHMVEIQAGG